MWTMACLKCGPWVMKFGGKRSNVARVMAFGGNIDRLNMGIQLLSKAALDLGS